MTAAQRRQLERRVERAVIQRAEIEDAMGIDRRVPSFYRAMDYGRRRRRNGPVIESGREL